MQSKIFFIIQFLIFCNICKFIKAKALLGSSIRPVEPNEFPAVVCILRNNPQNTVDQNMMCTGTLISTQDVLTSEQCFYIIGDYGFVVSAGSNDLRFSEMYDPIWWISYDAWANLAGISNQNLINDIGIIRVTMRILRAQIPPMPLSQITPISLLYDTFVETVGCGATLQMNGVPLIQQTVPLFIIKNEECAIRSSLIRGEFFSVPQYCICSLSYPFAFINNGDTGGPLILDDSLIAINVGVSPSLDGNFHPDKVNVHISIDSYRNFIGHVITI